MSFFFYLSDYTNVSFCVRLTQFSSKETTVGQNMQSEIVISGISGRFPESDDVAEFSRNLYQKIDLVTESKKRWEPGLCGLPKRLGQLKDISKFDNEFFNVSEKQAHLSDPQGRMLLETTYEAIVDAGYDPDDLRGRKIGVFIGNSYLETLEFLLYDAETPVVPQDSWLYIVSVQSIVRGEIEAAVVGGVNLCLKPGTSIQFHRLGTTSEEGLCRAFNADPKGYVRSEAIATVFVQKSDVARRKYASIIHIKTNIDGYKDKGITYPSYEMQKRLIQEVYQECKLSPSHISYVEAHGTGTVAGDPVEVSAIADVFCPGRAEPLWIGSVKSNMGHAEAASGLCALIKVLICMENGLLAPNLHFKKPNLAISALINGQVRVPTDPVPWRADYAAVNNFGFGASTVQRKKSRKRAVFFDYLKTTVPSREFFALLHKSVYSTSKAKPYRGYKVLQKDQEIAEIKRVKHEKKSVWYIFNCTANQLPSMLKNLMDIEVFASSVKKSASALRPYGLDLIDLLTNQEKTGRNITYTYSLIIAVQIALIDSLNAVGIVPNGMIGCGVEELLCGYADGSLSAEQVILAAYWTARTLEESKLEAGTMIDIGMSWCEVHKYCPKDIFPSRHLSEELVTVSGPKSSVKTSLEKLKAENIFTAEVESHGYALNCHYMQAATESLRRNLEKIMVNPKPRISGWISSSYVESEWNNPTAKLADSCYFAHNLVSPILLHEALLHIPKDAVVLKISPYHLPQNVIACETECLFEKDIDPTLSILSCIGR
ncbi:fatty acid synthase [Trichonephila inaurata madagascariensis]|uniref:Fatty acid synthase n=1 Tax=Trichonephila inaurata madagascariensis TaxID=2747483 RepID=A0A8X6XQX1_9ARAC|nr:fatty acid synthase [Trichonephila inaurata madagascariensis]